MFFRIHFGFALGCSALLLAGCTGSEPREKPPANGIEGTAEKKAGTPAGKKEIAAGPQTVTLHVPEMKMRGGTQGAELT